MQKKLNPERLKKFIKAILECERHFLSKENTQFLDDLYESSKSRTKKIKAGSVFYRARINIGNPHKPLPKEDMIPVPGLKSEGRVNPYNVTVLYLANKPEIAVAEVRPGLYEPTTVATFVIKRDLTVVDFTADNSNFQESRQYDADNAETLTWIEINRLFSTSLTVDETRLNYIPTQIISEFFKFKDYDGVMYQSQFEVSKNSKGIANENIALFDTSAAEATKTRLFQINKQIITVGKINPKLSI